MLARDNLVAYSKQHNKLFDGIQQVLLSQILVKRTIFLFSWYKAQKNTFTQLNKKNYK